MSFAVFGILDRNGSLFGYNQSDWCVYGYAARSIVELTFRIVSTYQSLQKSHKSKTDHQFRLLAHDQFAEVTELAIFFIFTHQFILVQDFNALIKFPKDINIMNTK